MYFTIPLVLRPCLIKEGNMNKFHCAIFCLFVQPALAQQADVNITNMAPIPVAIQSNSHANVEYRVVGFTSSLTDGEINRGYLGMHRKCASEVHPSARAAFSIEFIRSTVPLDDMPPKGAWVIPTNPRPFYRPDLSEGDNHRWTATEEAGGIATSSSPKLAMENAMNCSFYSSDKPNRSGLVGVSRRVKTAPCNVKRPIACAAPVATLLFVPTFEQNIKTQSNTQGKVLAPNQ